MQYDSALVWFRRDLRLDDHAALYRALKAARRVYCVFVFDREILDVLPSKRDRRVEFIRESVLELKADLENAGGGLIVLHDVARTAIPRLAKQLEVGAVFVSRDYEPAAISRDAAVGASLAAQGMDFHAFKDQAIFDHDEVLTGAGRFFSVFTPYKNAWLRKLDGFFLSGYPVRAYAGQLKPPPNPGAVPGLDALGFEVTNLLDLEIVPGARGASHAFDDFRTRMGRYAEARDYPAVRGPSYLSVHLRFGTISIRRLARAAWEAWQGHGEGADGRGAEIWLSELVWRDFYFHILFHNPHVVERAFKREYDGVCWESGARADALFAAWCEGNTGYPLVDAAMRQLNRTGYMHNRLRMVTASFLAKDLGLDWRRGEQYFAQHLNDFDLSANNGGWQWAASTGCDAQPYFRIFNPVTQSERFDPHGKFIRRYVPELERLADRAIHAPWKAGALDLKAAGVEVGRTYPAPIVDHAMERERTLARFKSARAG